MAKIFIIEDDLSLRRMYEMILILKGHQVIKMANNGETAIELFKSLSEKPDIILMDHRMPVKNGLETTKELLELQKDAKIIFTSADHSIKERALSIGAKSFIKKPFAYEKLISQIESLLYSNPIIG